MPQPATTIPESIKNDMYKMSEACGHPVVFLDFEFNRSQEPHLNLVCVSLMFTHLLEFESVTDGERIQLSNYKMHEIWLHDHEEHEAYFTQMIKALIHHRSVFVAYGAAAEARSILALSTGIDPHETKWVDLYAEWRQLTYNNNECAYGTYWQKGYQRQSVPPSFDPRKNKGRDNNKVPMSLAGCVGQMFQIKVDTEEKDAMRDLILEDKTRYSSQERRDIMNYCSSDVLYLPMIWRKQTNLLYKYLSLPHEKIFNSQYLRGEFMVSVAKMEQVGLPVNVEKIKALRHNFDMAEDELITDLVENHFPFYLREKQNKSQWIGKWKDKYSQFVEFIKSKGEELYEKWPRTIDQNTKLPTDTLSRKEQDLEQFDGITEIYEYRQCKKNVKQVAWFKEPSEKKKKDNGDFFDSVGSDGRVRTFLGAYGTQTSRNAPKASRFVLAMSSWLRCLIEPPKGYVVIAMDWASQEFGIAAVLSGDKNMIEAYKSGDPYLYFAKKAKAVPEDANPRWCKNPSDAPESMREQYQEYKKQRGLFKATVLGLQYQLGAVNLAIKLSVDTKMDITTEMAKRFIALHKQTFPTYWRWLDQTVAKYERERCLIAWDGWALLADNDNPLSVGNWPTQTHGGVGMRRAVKLMHSRGINIISPLHDAVYALAKEEDAEITAQAMLECMDQGMVDVIGDSLSIRIDVDIHRHGEEWVEEKGAKFYGLLKKYLVRGESLNDKLEQLKQTIYATDHVALHDH